jgi:hypothetical protein
MGTAMGESPDSVGRRATFSVSIRALKVDAVPDFRWQSRYG